MGGIQLNEIEILSDKDWITNYLKATIARQIWGNLGFYKVNSRTDQVLKNAQQLISNDQLIFQSLKFIKREDK